MPDLVTGTRKALCKSTSWLEAAGRAAVGLSQGPVRVTQKASGKG